MFLRLVFVVPASKDNSWQPVLTNMEGGVQAMGWAMKDGMDKKTDSWSVQQTACGLPVCVDTVEAHGAAGQA